MAEWHPIDTAPKDGTRILLYDGDEMNVAAWDGFVFGKWIIKTIPLDDYNEDVAVWRPTHWQPLPEPPKK